MKRTWPLGDLSMLLLLALVLRLLTAWALRQPGYTCLLYTSDAADDLLCVDLGGRRIIKKKKNANTHHISKNQSELSHLSSDLMSTS